MEEPIKEGEEAENKEEAVEDRVSENLKVNSFKSNVIFLKVALNLLQSD